MTRHRDLQEIRFTMEWMKLVKDQLDSSIPGLVPGIQVIIKHDRDHVIS